MKSGSHLCLSSGSDLSLGSIPVSGCVSEARLPPVPVVWVGGGVQQATVSAQQTPGLQIGRVSSLGVPVTKEKQQREAQVK